MLLYIIDTTGTQPETLGMFRIVSTTSRALFYVVECASDGGAGALRVFLAGHETRFIQTGREFVIDLDSSDFDFSARAI